MKFKFTIRGMLILTTLVAIVFAIGVRLAQLSQFSPTVIVVIYGSLYLVFFAIFFLPRYRREFKAWRERWDELKVDRLLLEKQFPAKQRPEDESPV